ncbi:hypothetical protein ACWDA3_58630 [Nonomuraea rubra]
MIESTVDLRGALLRAPSSLGTGVLDRAGRNRRNIERTLAALKAIAEAPANGRDSA